MALLLSFGLWPSVGYSAIGNCCLVLGARDELANREQLIGDGTFQRRFFIHRLKNLGAKKCGRSAASRTFLAL
jgi:hypothetical protein